MLTGNPIKFSSVPESVPTPAPRLGQDSEAVLRRILGLSEVDVLELRRGQVI